MDSDSHPMLYRIGTYITKKNPWLFDFGIKLMTSPILNAYKIYRSLKPR